MAEPRGAAWWRGGGRANFLRRLARELDERGTVDVLRHGVKDPGVEIRLAYFKPAHGLTPELVRRYEANRLVLVRQFRSEESDKTIDLALYVNGIPVATAELKNPFTNQNGACTGGCAQSTISSGSRRRRGG